MSLKFKEIQAKHPCFAMGRHNGKGRIHLPVSPGCNICCRFCDRAVNDYEERPGVTANVLTPEEAVEVTRRALEACPEITVAGIAGPGDTLATHYALDTFRLIGKEFPQLLKCMSTNGLRLPDYAEEIAEVGVDTLTVTVNAVEPEILAKICKGIYYEGKSYSGTDASEILIHNQLEGIQKAVELGVMVKINTVLIPEINAEHVTKVAETVGGLGAQIYNIIPLIPQHELSWCKAPDCTLLNQIRQESEEFLPVFRHCQHCRADAAGVLGGKDVSKQIYTRPIHAENTFSHG